VIPFGRELTVGLPRDVNERVLVEVRVFQKWLDEASGPIARYRDIGVMAIIVKIGSDEDPLRKDLLLEVLIEAEFQSAQRLDRFAARNPMTYSVKFLTREIRC
jgi:hypothetical protein